MMLFRLLDSLDYLDQMHAGDTSTFLCHKLLMTFYLSFVGHTKLRDISKPIIQVKILWIKLFVSANILSSLN